ncbi:MAG: hypothetical protein A3I92_00885 [Candidatus Yanofskybacteria bacterium RIFCSPLOWO2_02_FULL_43_10b]|uniref:NAD-dependent epimerase/dehydratase domain-containing protein n=1 Tax=Candidatus Yanofskybacteria bacterium RIFCSPLOWO2_02_FULL_43_10b TaxID=1802704 RepID=A0A1F8H6P3_9BACT|nr:MAG: hypothetical protein A3I92_00885 [Candidatus Yanofskybacteria bacterium RIFCSPLOWO2_02_FULL_43_10b]
MGRRVKKNIFITGSSGFIGRNLVEYLTAPAQSGNFSVLAPQHKDLELLDSTAVANFIKENAVQIVIHCANIGGGRDTDGLSGVVKKNLRIFFNIIRCLKHFEKLIHLGSGLEYGRRYWQPKMKEEYFNEHVPDDDAGFYKYLCAKYIESADVAVVNLRLFGVFGKYEKYLIKFISNAIARNILGLPIIIYQNARYDYIYIDDLMKIVEYFIDGKTTWKTYNVASGQSLDLASYARIINSVGENESEIIIRHQGLNNEYSADTSRLIKEVPEIAFTPAQEAIEKLYRWYKARKHLLDRDLLAADPYEKYFGINK